LALRTPAEALFLLPGPDYLGRTERDILEPMTAKPGLTLRAVGPGGAPVDATRNGHRRPFARTPPPGKVPTTISRQPR
jgi:hypothetical protein